MVNQLELTFNDFVVCPHCGKTFRHNKRYCPLVSKHKDVWSECVCLVHTCFSKRETEGGKC